MSNRRKIKILFFLFSLSSTITLGQERQWVEGFEEVEFHYNANRTAASRDFRGMTPGYMTAGWWAQGQMKKNILSWKTAVVPEKKATTFSFIGANSVLPIEFARGPKVKLTVNGQYALTFTLGLTRNFTWREGQYELKYISKRVEFPYFGSHRQLKLNGNSGIYQLSVPESVVEAGKPSVIQVEILPFEGWNRGWFMVKEHRDVLNQTIESLEGEIENLRQDMDIVKQQTHVLATQLYSNLLGTDDLKHDVIYTNGYRHLHPADLIRLQNGDILMMTREASEHYSNDGDVVMVRSKDGGKTWGERQVVSAIKDLDEREGCGIQLKDGTIVVGVYYNDLYIPDGTYNWNNKTKLPAKDRPRLGAHIITSRDNGKTWSEAEFIDLEGMPFSRLEGPTDAPIEMPDGTILMGVIGYGLNGDPKNKGAVMLKSTNKGRSWEYLSTMAGDPGGKMGGFMEPGIVRTRSGRIIAGLRNHGPDQAIYMTYSDDNGKTWVPAWKTDMIGHPVDLMQLSDGRVVATYGVREGPHTKPGGIRACFSSDNGKTWDISTEVQLRNDFSNWDIGYPESLELPGGNVLSAYYFNLFGKYYIGSTNWKP